MQAADFERRRGEIETYFDRTASTAWARLTSDARVSRIRATVRAGRDRTRANLLDMLGDISNHTLLDAGSGAGQLAIQAAEKGADVTAVDHAQSLVLLARTRAGVGSVGSLRFLVGDMTDPTLGSFDHIVAMDSLIHYEPADVVRVLASFAQRTHRSILFTYAPRTLPLAIMHAAGKLFPRGNRSPAIVPVSRTRLHRLLQQSLPGWRLGREMKVATGFYISCALELIPA